MRNFIIDAQFSFGGLDPFYEKFHMISKGNAEDRQVKVLFSVLYLYLCARIFDYVATSSGCSFMKSDILRMKI